MPLLAAAKFLTKVCGGGGTPALPLLAAAKFLTKVCGGGGTPTLPLLAAAKFLTKVWNSRRKFLFTTSLFCILFGFPCVSCDLAEFSEM